jgi:hypothetical protein
MLCDLYISSFLTNILIIFEAFFLLILAGFWIKVGVFGSSFQYGYWLQWI